MLKGDGFSAKPPGKRLFHFQNAWSGHGPAGQFLHMESAVRLCSHYTVMAFSWRHAKLSVVVWTSIQYVSLLFRDRRRAASFRHRNRAPTTVLMCEQKPYPVWFSWCPVWYPSQELITALAHALIISDFKTTRRQREGRLNSEFVFFFIHTRWLWLNVGEPNWTWIPRDHI